jgi:hypothetical protein
MKCSNVLNKKLKINYIHKAIMEVKPKQRGGHTHFSLDSILHLFPHNSEKSWTCCIIKICSQLRPCNKEQHKESKDQRITIKAIRLLHGYFHSFHTSLIKGCEELKKIM